MDELDIRVDVQGRLGIVDELDIRVDVQSRLGIVDELDIRVDVQGRLGLVDDLDWGRHAEPKMMSLMHNNYKETHTLVQLG